MVIKTLYREYFQKSRVFLYPALEIRRGGITPIQTYVSWTDQIDHTDMKLICLYHIRDDVEYRVFEKHKLLGNRLFEQFIETDNNQGIYIFDFSEFKQDWKYFLEGKYSKLSVKLKKHIKDFFRTNNSHYVYIESYLEPHKYYNLYADLLGVTERVLKEVVELTEKPLLEKETFEFSLKEIEFDKEKL